MTQLSEKALAPHSSTLAWKIPWTEEPGRLQSMGSWWVGHDWVNSLSLFTFLHWRRKWQPTPVFLPGESQGWGSLPSMGLHRVRHDWSDLAAAGAAAVTQLYCLSQFVLGFIDTDGEVILNHRKLEGFQRRGGNVTKGSRILLRVKLPKSPNLACIGSQLWACLWWAEAVCLRLNWWLEHHWRGYQHQGLRCHRKRKAGVILKWGDG